MRIVMQFDAFQDIPKMPSAENDHSIQRFPRFPHKPFSIGVARRFMRRRFYDFNALRRQHVIQRDKRAIPVMNQNASLITAIIEHCKKIPLSMAA